MIKKDNCFPFSSENLNSATTNVHFIETKKLKDNAILEIGKKSDPTFISIDNNHFDLIDAIYFSKIESILIIFF